MNYPNKHYNILIIICPFNSLDLFISHNVSFNQWKSVDLQELTLSIYCVPGTVPSTSLAFCYVRWELCNFYEMYEETMA